jgi:CopG family transcriptional regulator, nickel-responsive regulator
MAVKRTEVNNEHKIISISLKQEALDELETLQQLGYTGRSEAIRAAIRALSQEQRERSKLQGHVDAILIITYAEKHTKEIQELQHRSGHLVKTKLHNHLENHKCVEILVVNGEGARVTELAQALQTHKGVDLIRLVVP